MDMASVSHTPTIPVPSGDLASLQATCMALKMAVEEMIGTRGHHVRACIYSQKEPPHITHDGDFWLTPGLSTTLSVSFGGRWYKIADLQP